MLMGCVNSLGGTPKGGTAADSNRDANCDAMTQPLLLCAIEREAG